MLAAHLVDLLARPENKRHTLVNRDRGDVENITGAIGGAPTGLFNKQRHRCRLIDKAQSAIGKTVPRIRKIQKHAATTENPPGIGDK